MPIDFRPEDEPVIRRFVIVFTIVVFALLLIGAVLAIAYA